MPNDLKSNNKSAAKSGRQIGSKKAETKMFSPKTGDKSSSHKGTSIRAVAKSHPKYPARTSIITDKTTKPERQMTPVEKMDMVRDGVSKRDLEMLKSKTSLDYKKLSTLLSTTRATLINKKGEEPFNPSLSEKIVSIADIYSYGFEVFEDEATFKEWIFRPNQALGGKQPFELLDNQFGREEIKDLIGRIEHGVYS